MSTSYAGHHCRGRPRRHHSRLFARPLLMIGVLVAGALCFIVHALWPRWPGPAPGPDSPALPITVAGVAFNVPPASVRVPMQRRAGAHERVDLAFLWPSLAPPHASSSPVPAKGMPRPKPLERIFVTIAAAQDALPPAERMKSIYARYAESEAVAGPDGLGVLAFRPGTPYQSEDLIYDPAAPDHFLVRCTRAGAGATPGICLQVRRIGEAEITLRFPRGWLDGWRTCSVNMERLIASLRPRGG